MHTCIPSHRLKRSWHSCSRWVNAGNKNTHCAPSTKTECDYLSGWNKKKGHIYVCKNLTQKWWTPEIYLGNAEVKQMLNDYLSSGRDMAMKRPGGHRKKLCRWPLRHVETKATVKKLKWRNWLSKEVKKIKRNTVTDWMQLAGDTGMFRCAGISSGL